MFSSQRSEDVKKKKRGEPKPAPLRVGQQDHLATVSVSLAEVEPLKFALPP
jgi:hypothetical protein